MKKLGHYMFYDEALMPKRPTVLHIGAYNLAFARTLANRHPLARLILYEADPLLADYMRQDDPMPPNVTIWNAALTAETGKVNFYRHNTPTAGSLFANCPGQVDSGKVRVAGKSFVQILADNFLERVDLLMLNCEGAEIYALKAILKHPKLADVIRQMCVSFHCGHIAIYDPAVRDVLLRRMGVRYRVVPGDAGMNYYLLIRKGISNAV